MTPLELFLLVDGFAVVFVSRFLSANGLPRFGVALLALNAMGAALLVLVLSESAVRFALVVSMLLAATGTFLVCRHRRLV